jgi:NitT/TauT family transport system substrate-binding protein
MRPKRTAGMMALATCAALLAACGSGEEPGGLRQVSLAFALTVPDASQAYYTSLPSELGFWREEGLEVTIDTFDGSNATLTAVQAGQADVTNTGTAGLAAARTRGSDLVAYYPMATKNIYYPAVPTDSPIRSITDFANSTVGIQSPESTSYQYLRGILAGEGVDPASVDFIPVGTGAEVAAAITNGSIDTYQGSDTLYAQLAAAGVTMRPVPSTVQDGMRFITAMVASSAALKADPTTFIGLARGIARARAFAAANPEEAVRLHWKAYPESKPTALDDAQALSAAVAALNARLAAEELTEGKGPDFTTADVDHTVAVFVGGGIIPQPVAGQDLYTDEYRAAIDDFDVAATQQAAGQ